MNMEQHSKIHQGCYKEQTDFMGRTCRRKWKSNTY